MQPDAPRENSKQFFVRRCQVEWNENGSFLKNAFLKIPTHPRKNLSVVVHIPMPTPKSCKTFRFENDSLKKTECSPMLLGKTRNSFFVRRCQVEWNENGSFLKNAFLKIPNAFGDSRKTLCCRAYTNANPKKLQNISFRK